MQYTATVNGTNKKDVYVKIAAGTMPGGMLLKVTASSITTTGMGNQGSPVATITLTTTDQKLIKDVKGRK
ncbi:MAG: hypothetical protein ACI8ZN_000032 [Bacteroidia bacterium]